MNIHTFEVLEFTNVVRLVREKCRTGAGASLADRLVPFSSLEAVLDQQKKLKEMIAVQDEKGNLPLGETVDVGSLLTRASVDGSFLEPDELVRILRAARTADDVCRFLREKGCDTPSVDSIAAGLDALTPLQLEIARTIDEEGQVVDRASGELAAIRSEIESTRSEVRRILEKHLGTDEIRRSLQESIVTLRNGRYVLPVKEGEKRSVEGIIHDHSGSGATLFVEPIETVEKNNRLARLHREEKREIRRILRKLTDRVRENGAALSRNGEILAFFDFLQAKALLSRSMNGVIPRLERRGTIRIIRGRHPLLEISINRSGGDVKLVPLDLEYPEDATTLVLTGPNTGGKTVALKTVGLFALMAQAGLAIPAGEGTVLPFFRKVFAHIGDEQSIENSLSSFSARLGQMVRLLEGVGPDSLVLLDEVGTGTDPSEGAALAMSFLEEIHRRGALSLVTTHLGSLKVFVHDMPGMMNASMEFDQEKLWPTYRLEVGLPGTSHALEIAGRLGIPEEIVERARGYMGESEAEIESLLADLKERKSRLREKEESLLSEREGIDERASRIAEIERTMEREKRAWESERVDGAKRYLDESRAMVERLVRDLRSGRAEGEPVKEARRELENKRRELAVKSNELAGGNGGTRLGDLSDGDTVHVRSLDREGRIVGKGNKKDRVFVESGGIRIEVPLADLAPSKGGGKKTAHPVLREERRPEPPEGRHELDLRGMRAEEARAVVEKFLDDALLSGVPSVRIIHGIGTGVLRAEVTELLESDPRFESFELGGNGGFTRVEM